MYIDYQPVSIGHSPTNIPHDETYKPTKHVVPWNPLDDVWKPYPMPTIPPNNGKIKPYPMPTIPNSRIPDVPKKAKPVNPVLDEIINE